MVCKFTQILVFTLLLSLFTIFLTNPGLSEMEDVIPNLRDPVVKNRMKSLFTYSFLIILVPIGSMFLLKSFIFEAIFGYPGTDSLLYSAIAAVVLVHVVLIFWIRTAWDEGEKAVKED